MERVKYFNMKNFTEKQAEAEKKLKDIAWQIDDLRMK